MMTFVGRALTRLITGLIKLYQLFVSPLLGQRCRFHPSCSCYAAEAVERHGAVRGAALAMHRILRCHPWTDGGLDPVPPAATPSHDTRSHPLSHTGIKTSR